MKFGETWTYTDGLAITVSKPTIFAPSDTAAEDGTHKYHILFTVTVTNNTGKVYDPTEAQVQVQAGSTEGSEVTDIEAGLTGSPDGKLLPNRKIAWKEGFGVDSLTGIVIDVTPGFSYDDGLFTP